MHDQIRLESLRTGAWTAAWAAPLGWLLCAAALAQTAPSKTLGELIDQVKREQAKGPTTARPAQTRTPARKTEPPMLWTLTGANHQLVAEVLDNGTMHVLRLHEGERQFGPWAVERYSAQGLWLVARNPQANPPREPLFLPAPSAGLPLSRYLPSLPATPAPVAMGGPLPSTTGGPVPDPGIGLPPLPENFKLPKP